MKDEGDDAPRLLNAARRARERLVAGVAALQDGALRGPVAWGGRQATRESRLFAHMAHDRECEVGLREGLAALGWDAPAAVRHLITVRELPRALAC